MQNLKLARPLVCFDLETTGTDVARDRIVQIGLLRVEPAGSQRSYDTLVNPQMPIPAAATAVHGITDDDVADQPVFKQLAAEIAALFAEADILGFNAVRFDLPLLREEMARAGQPFEVANRRLLDALHIFHQKERRDLTAAYKFYCNKELVDAHSALADATATLEVLDAQLAWYEDLPRDVDGLHEFCNPDAGKWVDSTRKFAWNERGEAAFAFGKHRGRTLRDVATTTPDYFDWIVGSDFSSEVKQIAREARQGRFPRQK
jgi:DNA polymerase-3 subunit epsilon